MSTNGLTGELTSVAPKPIVIAGMGPGGLSAAVTAARNGNRVIIVESRDHFSRVQRISADANTLAFLDSLRDPANAKDTKFFQNKIFRQGTEGTVQVKDLQEFLTRKLEENFKDKVEIRRGEGNKIVSIDPENQQLTLQKPGGATDIVDFAHVIAADGARRDTSVSSLLNKSTNNPELQFHHQLKPLQARQSEVGTVSLTVKPNKVLPNPPTEEMKFNPSHMKRLLELGWDQPYFPRVYIFRNEKNTKFFVSGEVPPMIKNAKDEQAQGKMLEAWGQFMVSVRLGYPEQDVALIKSEHKEKPELSPEENVVNNERRDKKNALKSTVFALQMEGADKSAIKLPQGGSVVLVEDAYKSANFFFKHGMNDAIQDGILAAQSIKGQTFDVDAYAKQHARQEKQLDTRMGFADSQNEMPAISAKLSENITALIKLSETINDPKIKAEVAHLKGISGPDAPGFDVKMYQLQVEELQKLTASAIEAKLVTVRSKGGMLHSKDEVKVVKMQTELNTVTKDIQKSFSKYYDTNIEKRKGFHKQTENDPPPVNQARAKNR